MTIFRFSLLAFVLAAGGGQAADGVALPSGQKATLFDTIWEPQTAPVEMWLRLRFVVPGIAADLDFERVGADLLALCQSVALPQAVTSGKTADQAIISMSSEPLPFGETNPDVTQYFEAYRISGGDCILEGF